MVVFSVCSEDPAGEWEPAVNESTYKQTVVSFIAAKKELSRC
jgi:hypothetical protein